MRRLQASRSARPETGQGRAARPATVPVAVSPIANFDVDARSNPSTLPSAAASSSTDASAAGSASSSSIRRSASGEPPAVSTSVASRATSAMGRAVPLAWTSNVRRSVRSAKRPCSSPGPTTARTRRATGPADASSAAWPARASGSLISRRRYGPSDWSPKPLRVASTVPPDSRSRSAKLARWNAQSVVSRYSSRSTRVFDGASVSRNVAAHARSARSAAARSSTPNCHSTSMPSVAGMLGISGLVTSPSLRGRVERRRTTRGAPGERRAGRQAN